MTHHLLHSLLIAVLALQLLTLCSCTSTANYDTNIRVHYIDEEALKKDTDIKVPLHSKEIYNDINLGVLVQVDNQANFGKSYSLGLGDNKGPVDAEDMEKAAQQYALDYLARMKRFKKIYLGDRPLVKEASFHLIFEDGLEATGEIYTVAELDYCIKLKITLLRETIAGYRVDREVYKVRLQYELYNAKKPDGRPIATGTAKNLTTRVGASYSYSGAAIGGGNLNNARNAYRNVLENCMIEMRCQLAGKLPIAGNIEGGRYDNRITLLLDKGSNQGIVDRQQFCVFAKLEDETTVPLGYAVALGEDNSDSCSLILWKQSKSPAAKRIFKAWKKDIQGWIGDNEIYAVSIGMPPPPPMERTNIQDRNDKKIFQMEQKLLREWR